MLIKGIIFNLDGTLVNTLEDLTDSMNAVLRQLGWPGLSSKECRRMIGHGLHQFAKSALDPEHVELTDTLVQTMADYYRDNCLNNTAPYPGMRETIQMLSRNNIHLSVVTDKTPKTAEIIVHHFF